MKKKIKHLGLCTIIAIGLVLPQADVMAYDFSSNESYYLEFCSVPRPSKEEADICVQFKEYYKGKSGELEQQISNLNKDMEAIKGNIDLLTAAINEQDTIIAALEARIVENEAYIKKIQENIDLLVKEIDEKQKNIELRDKQIKERMLAEQPVVGINSYVDFMMGAKDLVDLMRIVEGIERITENDQQQIAALEKEREELDVAKAEQVRFQDEEKEKKDENVKNKQQAEVVKQQKQEFLASYRAQEAELNEKMRSAQVDLNAIRENMISINTGTVSDSAWTFPVLGGYLSAGTWYYPGGGVHLGMDIAASVGTPLVAPANSIVLYANNPAPTNGGYLGNWVGYPAGGGNTVLLLTNVNGTTYAVSFAHMARENFYARAGQQLARGQQFGGVGHSGNSTGPHAHIEVINLGSISTDTAIAQFQSHGAFDWGLGWGASALNRTCEVTGWSTPCRERPESIFY